MKSNLYMTSDGVSEILVKTFRPSAEEVLSIVRCLVMLVISYVSLISSRCLLKFLRFLAGTFEPMNYELDMTTENYCKNLAEVDNELKFQTMQPRAATQNDTKRSPDCLFNPLDWRTLFPDPSLNSAVSSLDSVTGVQTSHPDTVEHIYPNGWLPVMESSKVKPGEIKRALIMGRDVIVTRSLAGKASILDAYCPHMGVNIGVGGKVLEIKNESCVQCPLHGWTFRATDGMCVRIPYAEHGSKCSSIPKQAKLKTWICDEVNNFIFVWHHIDDQPPTWRLEQIAELENRNWMLIGRSCHLTNLDLRDMLENGADMNHFEGIHNDLFVFGGEYLKVRNFNWFQKYARHHWTPNWEPIVDSSGKTTHKAQLSLCSWISLFKLRLFDISLKATQIGPASVVLRFQSKWYGRGVLTMYSIPLGGRRTMYVQHIYTTNSYFDRFMAKWVLFGEIRQLERDLFMWNHKKTIANPIFMPEDKIVKQFRLWYSQFYKRKRTIPIDGHRDKRDLKVTSCVNHDIEF